LGVRSGTPNADFTELTQSFASQTSQRIAFYNLALYGQDEWHARPNLTFTIALRVEHQSNPVCQSRCFARLAGPFESVTHDPGQSYKQAILINQKQALTGTDTILWSPRFSFAWQPIGILRNTVIRGGMGIFHDQVPGNLAWTLSSNPPLVNAYKVDGGTQSPGEKNSLFESAKASNAAFIDAFPSDPSSPGKTLGEIQTANPNFFPPAITVPDAQTRSPQYQRWSLELQQAFGAGTSLNIGYTGHHGIHQLVLNTSANAFGFGSLPSGQVHQPPVPPCADPRFSEVTQITLQCRLQLQRDGGFSGIGSVVGRKACFRPITPTATPSMKSPMAVCLHSRSAARRAPRTQTIRGATGQPSTTSGTLQRELCVGGSDESGLGGRGPDSLVKGWQIWERSLPAQDFPYTVFDFAESASLAPRNYFGLLYAVPSAPLGSGKPCGEGAAYPPALNPCQPAQVLFNADGTTSPNPNARFVQSGCESGFDVGTRGPSDSCIGGAVMSFAQEGTVSEGPAYFNTDFAIMKNTEAPGWQTGTLGIGFQFFNFFNHPNFGFADNYTSSQTFGQIPYLEQPPTSILGAREGDVSARMVQLKVQLQF
jgi:hypothetical protein